LGTSIPTAAIGKACSRSTNSTHPVPLLSTELADARYQSSVVTQCFELPTKMMRTNTRTAAYSPAALRSDHATTSDAAQ
jgi:hypothetical protein